MARRSGHSPLPPPLEMACLGVLWTMREGTVKDVAVALAPRQAFAYTTVMTLLERLVKRGHLTRRKSGRSFVYAPAQNPAELWRSPSANWRATTSEAPENRCGSGSTERPPSNQNRKNRQIRVSTPPSSNQEPRISFHLLQFHFFIDTAPKICIITPLKSVRYSLQCAPPVITMKVHRCF